MDSPWSTPTQSEIGESEAALHAKLFDGIDYIRELGDGEPSMEPNLDSDFMSNDNHDFPLSGRSSRNNKKSVKKSPRGASKSPEKKTKGAAAEKRKPLKKQQTKTEDDNRTPPERGSDGSGGGRSGGSRTGNGEKTSPTKRRTRKAPSSNAGSDAGNNEDFAAPRNRRSPSKKRSVSPSKKVLNGDHSDEGISSASTRTLSTAATDTSGVSSRSPDSPTKGMSSPTKGGSPRKGVRSKARDVLTLPKPYNALKSDQVKRWNKELIEGKVIGADNEAELELFKSIEFTNALVLKVNQLAKQGLLDRKTLFSFAVQISRFKIPPADTNKCMTSFFAFARELTAIRINMVDPEQQNHFDSEEASWVPPIYPQPAPPLQPHPLPERPVTAKPRDPDSYDFKDEQVAKDYRKMWDKYHQMEAMLKQKQMQAEGLEDDEEED